MTARLQTLIPRAIPILFLAAALAGCDASTSPTGPELASADQVPAVVVGKVSVPARGLLGGPSTISADDLSGVIVTVDGTQATDTTDASGAFRLESARSDRIVLRFRTGGIDAKLELEGVEPGTIIRIQVTLSDDGASLSDSSQGSRTEFEGAATLTTVAGDAPTRTIRMGIADTSGVVLVAVMEGLTTFDGEGDIGTFDGLLAALQSGIAVKIEGEGSRQDDGSVTAAQVKVETDGDDDVDDDDDDDDASEFEGSATLVSVGGTAPSRTVWVQIALTSGSVLVDILEGITTFDNLGDLTSFSDVLAALEAGTELKIEGEGSRQDDGSITAAQVKVETDGDDDDDGENADEGEFKGKATLVSVSGTAPARAVRVQIADKSGSLLVDIAEGITSFDRGGDLTSFSDVLAALAAGSDLKIEGEGTRQVDGSIAASKVKVETDD